MPSFALIDIDGLQELPILGCIVQLNINPIITLIVRHTFHCYRLLILC